jgi:DNA-binding Lrp family transcriptional regulator
MPSAFILINCPSSSSGPDVIASLREMPEVEDAYKTQGMYDVVAKLSSENKDGFREGIARVRQLANIRATLTMVIVEGGRKAKGEQPTDKEDVVQKHERHHWQQ